jgi:plastocyanin
MTRYRGLPWRRWSALLLVAGVCVAGTVTGASAARVNGRITGALPTLRKSPDLYGKFRRNQPGADIPNPLIVILKPADGRTPPRVSSRPAIDQKDERFRPNALAVQVGTTVDFLNSDAFYHNVFSLSAPRRFDLGRYRKGVVKSVTFDKPGVVKLFCDIHPAMLGYVLVSDSPWGAAATPDGNFQIDDVPEGEYEAFLWHEPLAEPVTVGRLRVDQGPTMNIELSLPVGH